MVLGFTFPKELLQGLQLQLFDSFNAPLIMTHHETKTTGNECHTTS